MTNPMSKRLNVQQKIAMFLMAVLFLVLPASAQKKPAQEIFPTPEDAVVALVDAVKTNNTAKLEAILGPGAKATLASGDEVADRRGRDLFVAAYFQYASLSDDAASKTLYIGNEVWPFPIPVVKDAKGWRFDTAAGIEELLYRRIGRNELA
ncbi:MAG: DUF2950 family protein, partial [Candidatus Koribacter versatilis]|nr:DUF2950 family protein [Candidatus Koribacter versatilis]